LRRMHQSLAFITSVVWAVSTHWGAKESLLIGGNPNQGGHPCPDAKDIKPAETIEDEVMVRRLRMFDTDGDSQCIRWRAECR
jgi:hypothetical protein